MWLNSDTHPHLFDKNDEVIWFNDGEDDELISGEVFDDDPDGRRVICVNLIGRPDKLYEVRVYDSDDGGPIDYWVDELYDNLEEARKEYDGRVKEAEENTPFYACNLRCACDCDECPNKQFRQAQEKGIQIRLSRGDPFWYAQFRVYDEDGNRWPMHEAALRCYRQAFASTGEQRAEWLYLARCMRRMSKKPASVIACFV